ncbi:hypothetical protein AFLA_011293 [Aspergillus flavus NRRL3357]|nr:hypothetical protein AFLA_011293 [Aspergillus flavus NRRL3357]RMZ38336.1 hypothetical protein CA14_007599 [Aspergillus flavus]
MEEMSTDVIVGLRQLYLGTASDELFDIAVTLTLINKAQRAGKLGRSITRRLKANYLENKPQGNSPKYATLHDRGRWVWYEAPDLCNPVYKNSTKRAP